MKIRLPPYDLSIQREEKKKREKEKKEERREKNGTENTGNGAGTFPYEYTITKLIYPYSNAATANIPSI